MLIIDASDAPLGRLASYAAKQALLGKSIVVLNCESALVSGRKSSIIKTYKTKRARRSFLLKGPHFPKTPERIVKRTIRGMLPYKQERGRLALKRIICYNNTPRDYENSSKIRLQKILNIKTITLKELSQDI